MYGVFMKKITLIAILGNIALASLAFYLYFSGQKAVQLDDMAIKKVATLIPITHPSLEKIEQGVRDILNAGNAYRYVFTSFNANGNRNLMLSQAEEALTQGFDVIVPIATPPAQMIKEIAIRKNSTIPIVFVAAEVTPYTYMTGVNDRLSLQKQIDIFQMFKPLKKVLLVYNDAEPKLVREKEELAMILKEKEIQLETVNVYQPNELYTKVEPRLNNTIDAVFVLKDSTVVAGIDALVKLCNKYHIPLMVSDLDSVGKGAVLGFGVEEYDLGVLGGQKVKAILELGAQPSDLGVSTVNGFKIKLNSQTSKIQGLEVDPKAVLLMKHGEVI